jgi:hypothetical protein
MGKLKVNEEKIIIPFYSAFEPSSAWYFCSTSIVGGPGSPLPLSGVDGLSIISPRSATLGLLAS